MNKAVAIALVLIAFAQPSLACSGGFYRTRAAHVTRATKVETKTSATVQQTLPAQMQTSAINSADRSTAQCKKYFPNIGTLVSVPCSA